jgi:hypothetical protein
VRRAVEGALAPADVVPLLVTGGDAATAGDDDEADLLIRRLAFQGLAALQPEHLEADVLPPGGLGRDLHHAPVRPILTADDQIRHALDPLL